MALVKIEATDGTSEVVDVNVPVTVSNVTTTHVDYDILLADGTTTDFYPKNHVSKFSNPFKDRMYQGTQNTKPKQLNVRYEDYSSASFYRVKVTGGETYLKVGGGTGNLDNDDNIIY